MTLPTAADVMSRYLFKLAGFHADVPEESADMIRDIAWCACHEHQPVRIGHPEFPDETI
jgi:hypothetical protein